MFTDAMYSVGPECPQNVQEKVFMGPLSRITRDAISYIERNYLKETVIKHPDRPQAERLWNFPLAAIEEVVSMPSITAPTRFASLWKCASPAKTW